MVGRNTEFLPNQLFLGPPCPGRWCGMDGMPSDRIVSIIMSPDPDPPSLGHSTVQYSDPPSPGHSTVQYSTVTHLPLDTRTPGGCSAPPRPPGARRPGAGEQGTEVPSLLLSCYLVILAGCGTAVTTAGRCGHHKYAGTRHTHHTSCFMSCMK